MDTDGSDKSRGGPRASDEETTTQSDLSSTPSEPESMSDSEPDSPSDAVSDPKSTPTDADVSNESERSIEEMLLEFDEQDGLI
jgi:cell division control protein 6